MHNLKAAVIGRVGQGADTDTLHAITDILDDAERQSLSAAIVQALGP